MSNIANLLSNNADTIKKTFQPKHDNHKLERLKKLKDYVDSKEYDRTSTRRYIINRNKNSDFNQKSKPSIIIEEYEYKDTDFPSLYTNDTKTSDDTSVNKLDYSNLKASFAKYDSLNKQKKFTTIKEKNETQNYNKSISLIDFNTDNSKFETKPNIIFSEEPSTNTEVDTEWKTVSNKKKPSSNKWF